MIVLHEHFQVQDRICLMIGNYDGVHRGHQAILDMARQRGEGAGLKTGLLSFSPHPLKILAPDKAPPLIQTPTQNQALLAHYGLDYLFVQPFSLTFSQQEPDRFIESLRARIPFDILLVGSNFRFGVGRTGDVNLLKRKGKALGFEVGGLPEVKVAGATVSSTRIRGLLLAGEMEEAEHLLGRPYFMEGQVIRGHRLGTQMGIPTANLLLENELTPCYGVYASWVQLDSGWHRSVTNIGLRPSFGSGRFQVETHLMGFSGDLYGKHLRLCLKRRLRPEMKFRNPRALMDQIGRDVATRDAMNDAPPPYLPLPLGPLEGPQPRP